jgi:pimeloyl-ACP methyl ester carboxylesterase
LKRIAAIAALAAALLTCPGAVQVAAQETVNSPSLPLEDCRIRAGEGFPGIKARCGVLTRPEDPANLSSPSIELHVAVVPALTLEPEPDAFVPIAGGPGQSTIEFYAGYAMAFEPVRRNRDIVLVDQRGTGRSAPLTCDIDEDIIQGGYSREETIDVTETCLEQLQHDPQFFTTSIAVRDLEAVRQALGYSAFNVYGISYGTRVAQHFARRYPEATRTVIIDGVAPPQLALGPGIAIEAQRALDALFDRCIEDEACSERFPNIRTDFLALTAALDEMPVTVSMADPLTGTVEDFDFGRDELAGAIRLLSYHPSTVALIPLLVDEAVNGNYLPLASQFVSIAANLSEALNIGMHNAVICTEDAPFYDDEPVDAEALSATYIGPMQLDSLDAICSVWPRGVLDDDLRQPLATDLPVLLLSGEADPITPPAFADRAAVELENALHLTGRRQGHGLAGRGCTPDIIGDFVASASIEDLDASCLDRVFAMPFFLGFSGPAP